MATATVVQRDLFIDVGDLVKGYDACAARVQAMRRRLGDLDAALAEMQKIVDATKEREVKSQNAKVKSQK